MYYICNMIPGLQPEIIKSFESYSEADLNFDELAERLPNAWLEIVSQADISQSFDPDY